MCKQHFHLFALASRLAVCRCLRHRTCNVACRLIDAAYNLTYLGIWATLFFEWASSASLPCLDRYLISLLLVMPVRGTLKLRRKRFSSFPLGQM